MINLQYFELKINPYFVWKKAIITKVLQKCRIMADFLMLQCKNVHETVFESIIYRKAY
ncbi:hypothetical protein M972_111984 [Acetivibrio thermocellus AD2]|jgi:hypothetical protein|uniref:Uncharacterized protein n=2 Tax=Acetivibrio thermocellus TaxID=1515 RepID=G2JC65_ACET2|nr:hypothetical protein Clo1313_1899 [Acetivibrio thermocellus DSM 1313]AEO12387.1 Hypothetical protein CBG08354 [Acetivibrio thermocellus ATCC 27405]ALX08911.1 hypothetical protein AD2_01921 [Acetivibrio thermocellus AD2]ANV76661.1 hypothetical protein LQRI_1920 [Acetivibrio thermocellus DSM 2360]EIC05097.1 hypothetical protein YSBL_1219 [Acetivibrio thermocellus YS]CDG35003.1 hypothetical protein CTHBC1_0331 [Acetivibrio thermocellus BC1]SOD24350.1 hypothetical protein SAMN04515622_1618 [Ac